MRRRLFLSPDQHMSYVITIERPAGKSPLTPQDFAQRVKNDEYLSKTNDGVLIWTHPNIGQDFNITIETNHLWTDGVTRDKAAEFVEKLREIAGRHRKRTEPYECKGEMGW